MEEHLDFQTRGGRWCPARGHMLKGLRVMRNTPVVPRICLVASLAALGAACTGDAAPTTSPDDGAVSTLADIVESEPVPYLSRLTAVPYENAVVIEAARGGLMSQCMAEFGYEFVAPVVPRSDTAELDDLYPSDEVLAQYGYTWTLYSGGLAAQPESIGSESDPGYSDALNGCGAAAAERLDFSRFGAAQGLLANGEAQEIDPGVDADAQVRGALAAWSRCMAENGFSFGDPVEAQRSTSVDPLGQNSIALAVRDYACRRATDLEETKRASSTRLTAEWIERHPEAIAELNLALAELTTRADDVVAELDG